LVLRVGRVTRSFNRPADHAPRMRSPFQFLGGLLYWRLRRQARFALSSIAFLLASVPFIWDVLSQMLALRTSDWFTRSWTSALFTLACVFWCYPRLERNVEE